MDAISGFSSGNGFRKSREVAKENVRLVNHYGCPPWFSFLARPTNSIVAGCVPCIPRSVSEVFRCGNVSKVFRSIVGLDSIDVVYAHRRPHSSSEKPNNLMCINALALKRAVKVTMTGCAVECRSSRKLTVKRGSLCNLRSPKTEREAFSVARAPRYRPGGRVACNRQGKVGKKIVGNWRCFHGQSIRETCNPCKPLCLHSVNRK